LYVLGGCDENNALDSIELCDFRSVDFNGVKRISIDLGASSKDPNFNETDKTNELRWNTITMKLPFGMYSFQTFSIDDGIYLVGGKKGNKEKVDCI